MSNRVLISVQEDLAEPSWINNVEEFVQKVMTKLSFDGEEVSILKMMKNMRMKKASGVVLVILQLVWICCQLMLNILKKIQILN